MDGMKPEPLFLITPDKYYELVNAVIDAANAPTYSCCDRLIEARRKFYGHTQRRSQ